MKEIRRDFTAIVQVPDDASVDDVEITATMEASHAGQLLDPSVIAEDPYEDEQEKPEPPRPKCPECGKEIEELYGTCPAIITTYARLSSGILDIDFTDTNDIKDIARTEQTDWYCPHCEAVLFKASDTDCDDKMYVFLKGS